MITLYHVRGTRSVRPLWLCLELGLEVDVHTIDFSPAYRNSAEYSAISPAGKVPAMTDGNVTMVESGAMIEYLLERYGNGRLQPAPGTLERAAFLQWCWFAEATLSRPLGINRLLRGGDDLAEDVRDKINNCLGAVEAGLADSSYLPGPGFSAADAMMGYTLQLLDALHVFPDTYSRTHAYLGQLRERPAFQEALAT